ncbi:MAG: monothiol glutaredoxin grx5 [Alyxoria varia]|nr:MAG: monothiol glutaredoxin grx5 [Alyxoria varia]
MAIHPSQAYISIDLIQYDFHKCLRSGLRASPTFASRPANYRSNLLRTNPFQVRLLSGEVRTAIDKAVSSAPVVLFMKGTPDLPQCGFSRASVQILGLQGVDPKKFKSYNVLEDQSLREGIKEFSEWPTIPQLYVDKEFLGGCDILMSMHQDGSLAKTLEQKAVLVAADEGVAESSSLIPSPLPKLQLVYSKPRSKPECELWSPELSNSKQTAGILLIRSMNSTQAVERQTIKDPQPLRERDTNQPTGPSLKLPESLTKAPSNGNVENDQAQLWRSFDGIKAFAAVEKRLQEPDEPKGSLVRPRELENLDWINAAKDDGPKKPPHQAKEASKDTDKTAGAGKLNDIVRARAGTKRHREAQKQKKEKPKKVKIDHQFVTDFEGKYSASGFDSHYPPKRNSTYETLIKLQRDAFKDGEDSLAAFNKKLRVIQTSIKDMTVASDNTKDAQKNDVGALTLGKRLQHFRDQVEQSMPRNKEILQRHDRIQEEIAGLRAAVLGPDGEAEKPSGYVEGIEILKEEYGRRRAELAQALQKEAQALVERVSKSENTFDKMIRKKRNESRSFFEKLQTDDEF